MKTEAYLLLIAVIALAGLLLAAFGSDTPQVLEIDFSVREGVIRPLHDLHSGPLTERGSVDLSSYYRELDIRYIRLHDIPWTYGTGIDINYVFPDLGADPDQPEAYRFSETDYYIDSIRALEAQMIYRLGYSAEIKKQPKLHNSPPEDYEKWARICLNIVRHYNAGWAAGFRHGIQYWEVWNEPDIKNFWTGTPDDYYRLYEITARTLKDYDPSLKVGGPAAAGHLDFIEGFLEYCRVRKIPLDFLSWHSYSREPDSVQAKALKIRDLLDKYGFTQVESHLTEWNYFPGDWDRLLSDPVYERDIFEELAGPIGASYAGSVLVHLQDSRVDVANFYTGTTLWWGMFDRFGLPLKNYYTFKAFRSLLETPNRISRWRENSGKVAMLAGLADDQASAGIFISNFGTPDTRYELQLKNLPWTGDFLFELYLVDSTHDLQLVKKEKQDPKTAALRVEMENPSVCLIKLRRLTQSE